MKVFVQRMYDDVMMPVYMTDGAGCFDIYAYSMEEVDCYSRVYGTGLKFSIPQCYTLFLYSRSGHGFKKDIRLANCVGVIDSDFRGEVLVKLTCDREYRKGFKFPRVGERIVQGAIIYTPKVKFVESSFWLPLSIRGESGFGSTDKQEILSFSC